MKINNLTKNAVLAEDAVIADTAFSRVRGLLGKRGLKKGEALVLKPCNSVHTFFMSFPIDILFVDKNNRVIKSVSSLKPFRLTGVYFKASFVLELPSGTISSTSTQAGDALSLA